MTLCDGKRRRRFSASWRGALTLRGEELIRIVSSKQDDQPNREEGETSPASGFQLQTLLTRIKFSNPVVTIDKIRKAQIEDES